MIQTTKALLIGTCLCGASLAGTAQADRASARLTDMMLYEDQAYGVTFAQYEGRTGATDGMIGLVGKTLTRPAREPESTVHVRSEGAPGLGPRDRTLARDLAKAFCAHHGLTVAVDAESRFQANGVWTFRNLCLNTPDVQGS